MDSASWGSVDGRTGRIDWATDDGSAVRVRWEDDGTVSDTLPADRFERRTPPGAAADAEAPLAPSRLRQYKMLKVSMYFDDLSDGVGSLVLVPGSHHQIFAGQLRRLGEGSLSPQALRQLMPGAVSTRTRPGDIVFFDQKMLHSAWGAEAAGMDRAWLAITYGQAPTEDWHERWCIEHTEKWSALCDNDEKTEIPRWLRDAEGRGELSGRCAQSLRWLLGRGY